MNFISYPDREFMMLDVAGKITSQLSEELSMYGRASLSVPGGTTPGPIFDILAGVNLDWANVAVMLNDERWVGEDSPRSNTRLLKERLLVDKARTAQLIPLYASADEPEAMLETLAAGIAPHLPLTVLLLGMGADMHTASLFPGADLLAEALAPDAPVLMALRADAAGEPRITLTARVLAEAKNIHILITGPEKRAAIEAAANLPALEAPVRVVLDNATVHWAE
ncbi:MAG: 6-phosphogluconolactonase [Pseudorhodobacter sp. PARRP1]|nr:MAG: 6-phosphogluconolactonase [Pseudorhodobacter sp. PARRP1]